MGKLSREMETRKESKGNDRNQKHRNENLMCSINWIRPRKESVSLKKCSYKLLLKCKEKKSIEQNTQELWDNNKRYNIC